MITLVGGNCDCHSGVLRSIPRIHGHCAVGHGRDIHGVSGCAGRAATNTARSGACAAAGGTAAFKDKFNVAVNLSSSHFQTATSLQHRLHLVSSCASCARSNDNSASFINCHSCLVFVKQCDSNFCILIHALDRVSQGQIFNISHLNSSRIIFCDRKLTETMGVSEFIVICAVCCSINIALVLHIQARSTVNKTSRNCEGNYNRTHVCCIGNFLTRLNDDRIIIIFALDSLNLDHRSNFHLQDRSFFIACLVISLQLDIQIRNYDKGIFLVCLVLNVFIYFFQLSVGVSFRQFTSLSGQSGREVVVVGIKCSSCCSDSSLQLFKSGATLRQNNSGALFNFSNFCCAGAADFNIVRQERHAILVKSICCAKELKLILGAQFPVSILAVNRQRNSCCSGIGAIAGLVGQCKLTISLFNATSQYNLCAVNRSAQAGRIDADLSNCLGLQLNFLAVDSRSNRACCRFSLIDVDSILAGGQGYICEGIALSLSNRRGGSYTLRCDRLQNLVASLQLDHITAQQVLIECHLDSLFSSVGSNCVNLQGVGAGGDFLRHGIASCRLRSHSSVSLPYIDNQLSGYFLVALILAIVQEAGRNHAQLGGIGLVVHSAFPKDFGSIGNLIPIVIALLGSRNRLVDHEPNSLIQRVFLLHSVIGLASSLNRRVPSRVNLGSSPAKAGGNAFGHRIAGLNKCHSNSDIGSRHFELAIFYCHFFCAVHDSNFAHFIASIRRSCNCHFCVCSSFASRICCHCAVLRSSHCDSVFLCVRSGSDFEIIAILHQCNCLGNSSAVNLYSRTILINQRNRILTGGNSFAGNRASLFIRLLVEGEIEDNVVVSIFACFSYQSLFICPNLAFGIGNLHIILGISSQALNRNVHCLLITVRCPCAALSDSIQNRLNCFTSASRILRITNSGNRRSTIRCFASRKSGHRQHRQHHGHSQKR